MINTIQVVENGIILIDQTKLPTEEVYITYSDYKSVGHAIKSMIVRGAPAIGVTAAFGLAIGAKNIKAESNEEFKKEFNIICEYMSYTRPTAVNLFWAIDRMKKVVYENSFNLSEIRSKLQEEAEKIFSEDRLINRQMGLNGEVLFNNGDSILTHCNAGALATSGEYGTALGVIKTVKEKGKKIKVFADETRPFLQGARLTTWELLKENIPVSLITDNMAGYFMKKGDVDKIIVGADRIAANGDTANKIGTYSLSVLAKEHNIPFYVAAPISTIDLKLENGDGIEIENRSPEEVIYIKGKQIAPLGVDAPHPAFDVTPNENITAIITERGVVHSPIKDKIKSLF